jgi:hypothetical protein
MPIQKITAVTGVAKQGAKGTLATAPKYAHGLTGGTPVSVEISQDPLEVTAGRRAQYNVVRHTAANGVAINSPSYTRTLGLWLLGALGTDTVTGSAPGPYTHTYSTGDLPYLSIFTKGLASTNEAIRDCKIDELSLKWDGSNPVNLSVKAAGTVFSYPAAFAPATSFTVSSIAFSSGTATYTTSSQTLAAGDTVTITGTTNLANSGVFTVLASPAPTSTTFAVTNANGVAQAGAAGTVIQWADETASESFLVPLGGTFQLDVIGSTLVNARVVGGELTIKNNITAINPSATVEADDVYEGVQEHSIKLTIIPDDLAEFRKTVTGGAAGTAIATVAPTGSVNLVFRENNNASNTLTVTGSKIAFLTAFPDADPKGGPVEIELAGIPVVPQASGTTALNYVLINTEKLY